MSRDLALYLEDILSAAQKIQHFVEGMNYDQFLQDERTYDAVIRNLEVIGEAARQIPQDFRERFPDVEWRSISAFRNILAHEYYSIRDEIVWDIVVNKVPQTEKLIQEILKSQSD